MKHYIQILVVFLATFLFAAEASASCGVHDHNCQFHGIGRAVNHTINQNDPTAVYIISEGSNNVDFDNNVLLPDGAGPYVISTTGFAPRSNQPYISSSERPRTIYPTQYQIDFQQNTAQARHSGDLNGLSNIPGASGCTIGGGGIACEEIVIQGNIPDLGTPEGFVVRQTNYLYNVHNVPNPSVAVRTYAVTTGRAYFKENTHIGFKIGTPNFGVQQTVPETDVLSGTGAKSPEKIYNIGYNDFDAHAAGKVSFYNQLWRDPTPNVYRTQYGHQSDHLIADAVVGKYKNYDYTIQFGDADPATGQRDAYKTYDNVRRFEKLEGYINVRTDPAHLAQLELRRQEKIKFEADWARGCRDSACINLGSAVVWPGSEIANSAPVDAFTVESKYSSKDAYGVLNDIREALNITSKNIITPTYDTVQSYYMTKATRYPGYVDFNKLSKNTFKMSKSENLRGMVINADARVKYDDMVIFRNNALDDTIKNLDFAGKILDRAMLVLDAKENYEESGMSIATFGKTGFDYVLAGPSIIAEEGLGFLGIETDIDGTLNTMFEMSDSTYRDYKIDLAIQKNIEDGTLGCVIDRNSCNMNWLGHKVWVLGNAITAED